MLAIERVFRYRRTAASLQLVPVACLSVLGACLTDVDILRLRQGGGASGAAAASASNSPNILIMPGPSVGNNDDDCQAGHYVGAFNGTYHSAAWANGTDPLSVAATSSMGRPGLEFWLERIPHDCGSEEFCADFSVKGGKIRGFANPFSSADASADGALVAVRFEIDLAGDLDCSRGQFRGLLQNGCYDIATVLFRFEGTAPANYETASSSFTNGQWNLKEMAAAGSWIPPDMDIGGTGTWEASLVDDGVAPAADGGGLCDM